MLFLLFITPFLGSLKNYVKYKKFNSIVFIRSFYIYIFSILCFQKANIWMILIFERWFFFIFKILRSFYRDDYHTNRVKYTKKYNIKYT